MWRKIKDMQSVSLAVIITIFLTIFQDVRTAMVEVEPPSLTALPGQSVQVLCKVAVPLQYCRIVVPGYEAVNLHPKAGDSNRELKYYGAGLAAGQCGATITRVIDKNNGVIQCMMGTQNVLTESKGQIQLLVAKPPKRPELDVSRGSAGTQVYRMNDVIQAACYIRDGRPAANITWYLDDEVLYEGLSDPILLNSVDDLQTVQQNLTRRLIPDDNNKQLRCVAGHIALDATQNNQQSYLLDVKYPPLPSAESQIDLFGYELGKPGTISLEINANPKPQVQWKINDVQLTESNRDPNGRFEASALEDLGRGRYRANLYISEIRKEDTEQEIHLYATNAEGAQAYSIVVSTSAEPQGLELGAGPIIGIVISILVVLLIIFLVIYARASGRWCFGGAVRNNPNYESSDTESTANIEAQKKNKFSNLKLFFKQKKDNKTDPEQGIHNGDEDENNSETERSEDDNEDGKKDSGIVYAELDLVKTNAPKPLVKKEDEKTEYAEIIYTKNDKPEQNKIENDSNSK